MSHPRLTVAYVAFPATNRQTMVAVLEPSRMNPGRWNVWAGGKRPIDTMDGQQAERMFPEHRATISNFDRFR